MTTQIRRVLGLVASPATDRIGLHATAALGRVTPVGIPVRS